MLTENMKHHLTFLILVCVSCLAGCRDQRQYTRGSAFDQKQAKLYLMYQTGDVHVAESALRGLIALHDEYKARGVKGIYVDDDFDKGKAPSEVRLGLLYREIDQPQEADHFMKLGMMHKGRTNETSQASFLEFIDILDKNMKVKWRGFDSQPTSAGDSSTR